MVEVAVVTDTIITMVTMVVHHPIGVAHNHHHTLSQTMLIDTSLIVHGEQEETDPDMVTEVLEVVRESWLSMSSMDKYNRIN